MLSICLNTHNIYTDVKRKHIANNPTTVSKLPENLVDTAFETIKKSILDERYAPDQKLTISTLAKNLNVSTIPIREALAKLNAINLVIYTPNQGYRVAAQEALESISKTQSNKSASTDAPQADTASLPRPAAIKQALAIFSDPWAFAVLEELFFGVRRFDQFQRNLKISRSVLTRRLRHLEQKHIIDRIAYSDRPKRFEYRLTERGRDMYPIFVSLQQWGERWLDNSDGEQLKLIHSPCEHELRTVVSCEHCQKTVDALDVRYETRD